LSEPTPNPDANLLPSMLEGSRLGKPHKQILALLHSREVPLSAKEIWKTMNLQRQQHEEKPIARSSYRVYLRQLHEKGYVIEATHGFYTPSDKLKQQAPVTNGFHMGVVKLTESMLPRVHNVRLVVHGVRKRLLVSRGSWKVRSGETVITFVEAGGDVITVTVDCDDGYSMDWASWQHVRDLVMRELGVSDRLQIRVSSAEFNRDYEGLRLDGAQAVTLYSFDGTFERYYNKAKGLRHEVKATNIKDVTVMDTLLKGGVTAYNVAQAQFAMSQEIRSLAEVVKGSNRLSVDQQASLMRLFEGFFSRFDRMLPLLEQLGILAEKVDKVTEGLGTVQEHQAVLSKSVFSLGRLLTRKRKRKPKQPKPTKWERLRRRLQR
jgi:hypothetical protein